MRNHFKTGLLTILWCCSILMYASGAAAAEKIIQLASTEYPPYYGEQMPKQGFITEIVKKAFARSGYGIQVEFFPWARAEDYLKRGKRDGLYTMWYRPEREVFCVFSDPLPPNELIFLSRKDSGIQIDLDALAPLKKLIIGKVRGYSDPPILVKAGLRFEEANDDEQNLNKLYYDRIHLILIDRIMAKYLLNTKYPKYKDEIEFHTPPVEVADQFLVISKRAKDYKAKLAAFNSGLRFLREKGIIESIMLRYGFE